MVQRFLRFFISGPFLCHGSNWSQTLTGLPAVNWTQVGIAAQHDRSFPFSERHEGPIIPALHRQA